ncbi:MAG: WXG100 family type VII secretion target [Mycobacterium sp.]|jgi:uncharacterized protein YukE
MTEIVYNHGAVTGFAGEVGSQAAQLMEIHEDVRHLTQSLADFFLGHGATAFFDAQNQMLSGLEDLIQVVSQHSQTINNVDANALATDMQTQSFFT